jgi:hypothetical protein
MPPCIMKPRLLQMRRRQVACIGSCRRRQLLANRFPPLVRPVMVLWAVGAVINVIGEA